MSADKHILEALEGMPIGNGPLALAGDSSIEKPSFALKVGMPCMSFQAYEDNWLH